VARIVASWPARVRAERAARLGLTPDPDFDSIIRMHLAEFRPGAEPASGGRNPDSPEPSQG
jgi:hypothetical protein